METLMWSLKHMNWMAIIVATIANFAIGALWYSPVLFGQAWIKEMGWEGKEEEIKEKGNMGLSMGGGFVLSLVMAITLAILSPQSVMSGIRWGLLISVGIGVASAWKGYLFEQRSFKMMMINGAHEVVTFVAMGAIIGGWQ